MGKAEKKKPKMCIRCNMFAVDPRGGIGEYANLEQLCRGCRDDEDEITTNSDDLDDF